MFFTFQFSLFNIIILAFNLSYNREFCSLLNTRHLLLDSLIKSSSLRIYRRLFWLSLYTFEVLILVLTKKYSLLSLNKITSFIVANSLFLISCSLFNSLSAAERLLLISSCSSGKFLLNIRANPCSKILTLSRSSQICQLSFIVVKDLISLILIMFLL